jgi:ATP-binding cassette subfamily B protein
MRIAKGSRVGFIGTTGSGKSTLLDIIMGLLQPSEGQLRVDGQPITEANAGLWQRRIAHVPQSIYLSDASIAENIAFGVPREDIDMERVRQAAAKAQMASTIQVRAKRLPVMGLNSPAATLLAVCSCPASTTWKGKPACCMAKASALPARP